MTIDLDTAMLARQVTGAARWLAEIPDASVQLGCCVDIRVLRELAIELGGHLRATVQIEARPPDVIVALEGIYIGEVAIHAQGSRPLLATDLGAPGFVMSECRSATSAEVEEAIQRALEGVP